MNDFLKSQPQSSRIGLHYFPDAFHFRQKDLETWLPHLLDLQVSWLVLDAPLDYAIPEPFITGLIQAGIQPLLQLKYSLEDPIKNSEAAPLFEAYARWGIKHIILFDRPNLRNSWHASSWGRQNLVDRFLDRFVPLAALALQYGISPVFPALEAGGDYWDLTFLKGALQGLKERRQPEILEHLHLACYAYTYGHDLNWGSQGPAQWKEARPYSDPNETQDQRGFRIFDWANAVTQSELDEKLPIFLLEAGKDQNEVDPAQDTAHIASTTLDILNTLTGDDDTRHNDPIPNNVLACNFWLLSDSQSSSDPHAWFHQDGQPSQIVQLLLTRRAENRAIHNAKAFNSAPQDGFPGQMDDIFDPEVEFDPTLDFDQFPVDQPLPEPEYSFEFSDPFANQKSAAAEQTPSQPSPYAIQHYLLLPAYDWGISDFHLEAVRPFVKKYHATLGFSLSEAALAEYVTVIGDEETFPEADLDKLRFKGAVVERINGDGTTIASLLAQR